MTTTASLPLSSPVAALLAAEGTRRGLPHPLPEQALADALRRSQASVGQAKRRGAGVTVRLLAGMARALGGRLVLSVEWDATVLADIVGPARGVEGRECEEPGMVAICDHCGEVPWLPRRARKARAPCPRVETADADSAARGAGESEEQKRWRRE